MLFFKFLVLQVFFYSVSVISLFWFCLSFIKIVDWFSDDLYNVLSKYSLDKTLETEGEIVFSRDQLK